jgi:hypothetical protein
MKLDMQKIYIDSRFRTANSNSPSDFNVELPRSFNVPDGVVAHIDDIVIPVSWRTVDDRNNRCYVQYRLKVGEAFSTRQRDFTIESKNYDGDTFKLALAAKLNAEIYGFIGPGADNPVFVCGYDAKENHLTINITDPRGAAAKAAQPFTCKFFTDAELIEAKTDASPHTINTIIRNITPTLFSEATPYTCFLDLFNTRNLYLTSSALCSYDTVSNFGMDTIIKKIPCTAKYNMMIFQSSGSTLDGLDVSKRSLRYLDFKLVDSSFRTVDLQGNHFSFSIVFHQKR